MAGGEIDFMCVLVRVFLSIRNFIHPVFSVTAAAGCEQYNPGSGKRTLFNPERP